ncbi:MAG: hypothetical protein H8E48_13755, partial [Chloroflexi bacterium]|nr:hypothetical protein [Chloroflexota bacterium]
RHRLLEKATHYEQVLITTTDLEQVSDFFGSGANYHYIAKGQVWPSDQDGNVSESPVSFDAENTEAAPPIDESA